MKKKQQIGGAARLSLSGTQKATKLQPGDRVSVVIQGKSGRQTKAPNAITLALARPTPNEGTVALRFSQLLSFITDGVPDGGTEDDKLFFPFNEPLVITDLIAMATGMELVPLTMGRPLTHLYELRRDAARAFAGLEDEEFVSVDEMDDHLNLRFWWSPEREAKHERLLEGSLLHFPSTFENVPMVLDLIAAITGFLLVQPSDSSATYTCRTRTFD